MSPGPAASSSTRSPGCGLTWSTIHIETGSAPAWNVPRRRLPARGRLRPSAAGPPRGTRPGPRPGTLSGRGGRGLGEHAAQPPHPSRERPLTVPSGTFSVLATSAWVRPPSIIRPRTWPARAAARRGRSTRRGRPRGARPPRRRARRSLAVRGGQRDGALGGVGPHALAPQEIQRAAAGERRRASLAGCRARRRSAPVAPELQERLLRRRPRRRPTRRGSGGRRRTRGRRGARR